MDPAVADLSHIPVSPALSATLARASEGARATGAAQVSLEHLLAALCDDPEAVDVLAACRIDAAQLKDAVIAHLVQVPADAGAAGAVFGVSPELRRILEAAAAAARGGRRRDISGAIVLAAVVGDGASPAAQILQGFGLTFEDAIRALQAPKPPAPAPVEIPATEDILARARERVQARAAPSLREIMHAGPSASAPAAPALDDIVPTTSPWPAPPPSAAAEGSGAPPPAGPSAAPGAPATVPSPSAPSTSGTPGPAFPSAPSPESAPAAAPAGGAPGWAAATDAAASAPSLPAMTEPLAADRPAAGIAVSTPAAPSGTGATNPAPVATAPVRDIQASAAPAPVSIPMSSAPSAGPAFGVPATPAPGPVAGPGYSPPGPVAAPVSPPMPGGLSHSAPGSPPPATGDFQPQWRPAVPAAPDVAAAAPAQPLPGFERPRPAHQPPPIPPPIPRPSASGAPASGPPRASRPAGPPAGAPAPAGFPGGAMGGPMMSGAPPAAAPAPAPRAPTPRSAASSAAAGPAMDARAHRKPEAELGQLAENIPRTMRTGVTERVEIRIGRAQVENLTAGMDGAGAAWRHDLLVTKAMSVRMRAPDGGVFIETASPETQWIDNQFADPDEEFASWRFLVTPQRRGWTDLQIVVSARTVGAEGLAAETAFPDQVVTVKVRANYARAAGRGLSFIGAAIAGGVFAKFGDGLWSAAAELMAKFNG